MLILLAFIDLKAQDINAKNNTLNKVFNDLVNAYGNPKGKPALIFISKNQGQNYIAAYFSDTPNIKVDEKLFDICMQMGADSLNALSIILSHELAHYYNDHNWCGDYAFAIRNTPIGKQIKAEAKSNKINHEREADYHGLYYCCIAGYHPFGVYRRLLNGIYLAYRLPEKMEGYPTKKERETICTVAEREIRQRYSQFVQGDSAISHKDYEKAIKCFEELNTHFASRENYNNAGTAKTLWALKLKPLERIEIEDTNFFYPIEIDHESRLKDNGSRSVSDGEAKKMDTLLQSAKKDFEKAISLDPNYDIAVVNLACVFDLMEKPKAAIGKIEELPQQKQITKSAFRILGIAYYHLWIINGHSDDKEKSKEMFIGANNQ